MATILSTLISASAALASPSIVLLYQNDGNWTNHASNPSALFVQDVVSLSEASSQCALYGEQLLDSSELHHLREQLDYQGWLGNFNGSLWLSDSESTPYQYKSKWVDSKNSNQSTAQFLCTNSAPQPTQVDTDYAPYPTMAVESNGTTFTGLRDHMAFRFLGIPFAAPPTGDLRFKYAQPYIGSTDVNATRYAPACLQYGYFDGNSYGLNP